MWRHEALDFTRWLEDNIDVLAEAVGIELTAVERERAAGDFSVDLIGEDSSGRVLVIENQLERSNHDHLGKLITYLAVLEAQAAIWIVAEPRAEHVTAIGWLNESRGAEFFLVKAEAVAIDESPPAPLLTLIVGPSEEAREVGDTKKELAERHDIRKRFWAQLLDRAKSTTRLHSAVSPSINNWLGTGAGISGLAYNYVITQHTARVELYIDRGDEEQNSATFEQFAAHKDEIETRFGDSLDWQPSAGNRSCRINYDVAEHGYRDEDAWASVQKELIEAMKRLESALSPHIDAMRGR